MWEDDGAAIGQEGILKGDGGIEILPNEQVAVIESGRGDLEQQFVRFRDRSRHMLQSQGVVIVGGRNGDGPWHGDETGQHGW